jgi:hypothetical protein
MLIGIPQRLGAGAAARVDLARAEVLRVLRGALLGDSDRERRFLEVSTTEAWRVEVGRGEAARAMVDIAFGAFFQSATTDYFSAKDSAPDAWRAQLESLEASDPRVRRARQALAWWTVPEELDRSWAVAATRYVTGLERVFPWLRATPELLLLWSIAGGAQAPCNAKEFARQLPRWKTNLLRQRQELGSK